MMGLRVTIRLEWRTLEASLKVDKRLPPPPSLQLMDTADVKVDSNFTMFIVQHTWMER